MTSGNSCGQSPQYCVSYYTLHFVAQFDKPFDAGGTWQDDKVRPGTTEAGGGTGYGGLSYPPIGVTIRITGDGAGRARACPVGSVSGRQHPWATT